MELIQLCVLQSLGETFACIVVPAHIAWKLEKCIVWIAAPSSVVVDIVWGMFVFR